MEQSRSKAGGNDKNNVISTEKADEEYNTESGVLEADCNGADIGNPLSVYDLYFAGCSAHSTPCFNEHFFTLFLGAAAILTYNAFRSRQALQKLSLLPLLLCMLLAYVLQTDYGALGVLAIFVCYYGSNQYRLYRLGGVILLEAFTLLIQGQSLQADDLLYTFLYILYASLSLLLLSRYNGKKGTLPKWIFYTFYPLHITILVALYTAMH